MSALVKRAGEVLREEGISGFGWKSLAATCYRRVAVHCGPPGPEAEGGEGLDLLRLESGAVDPHLQLRPDVSAEEVERRLAAGGLCVMAMRDGTPVSARWYAFALAEIPYLGLGFELAKGSAYIHDAYTAPRMRGRAAGGWLRAAADLIAAEAGAERIISAIVPENTGGMLLARDAGRPRVGTVGVVRAPGRRVLVQRVAAEYLGRAVPLDVSWRFPPPQ